MPANPKTLNQLVIQGQLATTGGLNPVRFLLHDNGPVNPLNSRIVIYATDDQLNRMARANRWYADGNFKLVPTIFKQLYVVRIRLGGTMELTYACGTVFWNTKTKTYTEQCGHRCNFSSSSAISLSTSRTF